MNKQFENFLKNKAEPKNPNACDHDKDHWCSNCIAKGTYHDFREKGLGHGFTHTNFLKD